MMGEIAGALPQNMAETPDSNSSLKNKTKNFT